MDFYQMAHAAFLGMIEGLTEFIPVSSTGHLILVGHFLSFSSPGHTFEVLIQLGAIAAILSVYSARLLVVVQHFHHSPAARHFVYSVVLAFLPAIFIGVLAHGFIKNILFASPQLVCLSLILGGLVLLIVDRLDLKPRYNQAWHFPLLMSLGIGFCQCLAMIPGVSRSGATIVGALLMGADKRSAAEFSFFLAMPTMAAAFSYDLAKNYSLLSFDDALTIIIGFVVAFLAGVVVVRHLLDYISRHGFALFAWWRLIVGCVGLGALMLFG